MEKPIVTYMLIGAAVLLTVGAIMWGIHMAKQGEAAGDAGSSSLSKLTAELEDADTNRYDGVTISGSEVLNAIKNYDGEKLSIKVVTNKSTTYYGYKIDASNNLTSGASGTLTKAETLTDNTYINPTGQFKGSILKDANDVTTCLVFTQE